jgi:DNA invertase Pin-like site-specific DNA recombinase
MGKFVSYLRVSTARQGRSGLGLEAQRQVVKGYLDGGRWTLVEEVIEVESGKLSARSELAKALALCRLHRARLLVAKLDRLSRSVAFIATLMESGVRFVVADLPEANEITVHIMAAMAEHERKAISERTRLALAAAKARGTRLGGLRWDLSSVADKGRVAAIEARREASQRHSSDVRPVIEAIKAQGATSLRQIAAALNERGIAAPWGGKWHPSSVRRVLPA